MTTGTNLVGTRVGPSQIDSFRVGFSGRLTAAPDSPLNAQAAGPFGSEFRPTDPRQLFVSNAHAGADNGTVSAFGVAGDGGPTPIGSSPFADQQTAPSWVDISHDGRFLFTVNTGSGSISRYAITDPGHEPRHVGTLEPLWNLFDLAPEGRPGGWVEQFSYD